MADELRDADLQVSLRCAETLLAKREEEKAAYASFLKRLFDQYKDAHQKHYEEETASLSACWTS